MARRLTASQAREGLATTDDTVHAGLGGSRLGRSSASVVLGACSRCRILRRERVVLASLRPGVRVPNSYWLGLLLAVHSILACCGLWAHLLTAPQVSSLVEGHSLACTSSTIGERRRLRTPLQT
jgi:hypothetical protein